jgi:hypothetical protein
MGNIKDGYELGMEIFKFWSKFKGRRVRIWPSELTIRICSESGKKWVKSQVKSILKRRNYCILNQTNS